MTSALASALALPGIRQLRQSPRLNTWLRKGHGPYWGRFPTREDAIAFLRPADRASYDDPTVATINADLFSRMYLFDWPVLFFFRQLAAAERPLVITDFGGHVGVKYYAYRSLLSLPAGSSWQVVDVAAACEEGRRRRPVDAHELHFFQRLEDTRPCNALLLSGVLQYVPADLGEIVGRAPARPSTVILNKVAVVGGDGFYTLEAFGVGRMPYRILSRAALDEARLAAGYRLLASWAIPERDFEVSTASGPVRISMVGQAWGE